MSEDQAVVVSSLGEVRIGAIEDVVGLVGLIAAR
jgi:hypothetical protein